MGTTALALVSRVSSSSMGIFVLATFISLLQSVICQPSAEPHTVVAGTLVSLPTHQWPGQTALGPYSTPVDSTCFGCRPLAYVPLGRTKRTAEPHGFYPVLPYVGTSYQSVNKPGESHSTAQYHPSLYNPTYFTLSRRRRTAEPHGIHFPYAVGSFSYQEVAKDGNVYSTGVTAFHPAVAPYHVVGKRSAEPHGIHPLTFPYASSQSFQAVNHNGDAYSTGVTALHPPYVSPPIAPIY